MDEKDPWKGKDILAVFIIGLILGLLVGIWIPDSFLNYKLIP